MRSVCLILSLSFSTFLAACGDSEETEASSTGGDAGDGKIHPPTNGQRTAELAACSALQSAFETRAKGLGCVYSIRPCPDFVRSYFKTQCFQYDQGTIDGCIDHLASKDSCDALNGAFQNWECVIYPYADSAPGGCP